MSRMSSFLSGDQSLQSLNQTDGSQNDQLATFCREVRNLLKSKPYCLLPISKFVPAYHCHYGRQCHVNQFGFTKLIELLEAIPQVVQIVGDGSTSHRYVTLTYREQIKRFASDLIKVIKSRPGKRLRLSQFAEAYQQVLGRAFRVEDYGTNNINVLLDEIWEGTINITPIPIDTIRDSSDGEESSSGLSMASSKNCANEAPTEPLYVNVPLPKNPALDLIVAQNKLVTTPYITHQYPDCWFEIPKRERSEREIKRTKYFIWDCIELLSKLEHNNFSVQFSKFIPAYHYYFNRQCKVSVFGFSKLIDLFESISPEVVEIIDQGPDEEKLIKLAKKHWPQRPIDCGPTEEELEELERELEDYEQMQCKRSTRMAAIF